MSGRAVDGPAVLRYRMSPATVAVSVVSVPAFLLCVLIAYGSGEGSWLGFAVWIVLLEAFVMQARYCRIHVSERGVRVRNLLWRYDVSWSQVDRFDPGKEVEIRLVSGETVVGWAVQRANLSGMLGRRSRVDQVVEELEDFRHRAVPTPSPPDASAARRRWAPLTTWSEWLEVGAFSAVVLALAVGG